MIRLNDRIGPLAEFYIEVYQAESVEDFLINRKNMHSYANWRRHNPLCTMCSDEKVANGEPLYLVDIFDVNLTVRENHAIIYDSTGNVNASLLLLKQKFRDELTSGRYETVGVTYSMTEDACFLGNVTPWEIIIPRRKRKPLEKLVQISV